MDNDSDITGLTGGDLRAHIGALRKAIRCHRDQRGDDRCWLDDWFIYELLPDWADVDQVLPAHDQFMEKCRLYHELRSVKGTPSGPAAIAQDDDKNLPGKSVDQLRDELARMRAVIRRHRDKGDKERTWRDDEELYRLLPENIPADMSLPTANEFLASCERFFASRGNPPKLHEW